MELLGFYDEPYRVYSETPRKPRIVGGPVFPGSVSPVPTPPLNPASERPRTKDLVADLWETTEVDLSRLEGWSPGVVARRKLGGRLRTATVVVVLAIVAAVAALGWGVFARPAQVASERAEAFTVAADGVTAALSPLVGVAESLGAATPPDLVDASAALLEAESATRDLFSAAGDLPDDSSREAAVGVAGEILETTGDMSKLVAFRLAVGQGLVPPDLPTDVDVMEVSVVTERIAEWRAGVDEALGGVPEGVLPQLQAEIAAWHEGHQSFQVEYLDAYRELDGETVARVLTDQVNRVDMLRSRLLDDLTTEGDRLSDRVADAASAVADLSVG